MNDNYPKHRCGRAHVEPQRVTVLEHVDEMRRWRKTLSQKQRAKLDMQSSPWGRKGGSIVALKRRWKTKTARTNELLRREREARFQAEQADYEARLAAPWKVVKSRAA
jgi:hypothetical protein